MAQHAAQNEKKNRKPVLLIVLLLLAAAAAAAYFLLRPAQEPEPEQGPVFAPNASVGALPNKTQEEIEAILTQQITDKTVAYSVNSNPIFANGTAEGNLMLESPANNINYIEFVIRVDETNEIVYRSGLLKPNQYIENDKLLVDLEPGDHNCTVDITIYDTETYEAKGMTQAGIVISVKE